MNVLKLIASSGFITVNKEIIKKVGLHEAIMLGDICSKYQYWLDRGELKDSYFYCSSEMFEEDTTLSWHQQKKAIDNLEKAGLIETKLEGLPRKKFFKINEESLEDLFL